VKGTGLSSASVVRFGAVPARTTSQQADGSLLVTIPDDVIGDVSVTVANPGDVAIATAATAFTFTLTSHSTIPVDGQRVAARGRRLAIADATRVHLYDTTVPTAVRELATVTLGASALDLELDDDSIVAVTSSALYRWSLARCTPSSCILGAPEVTTYVGGNHVAVGTADDRLVMAVTDGDEATLFASIDGVFDVVASTVLEAPIAELAVTTAGIVALTDATPASIAPMACST
jgi:hypothetical protein